MTQEEKNLIKQLNDKLYDNIEITLFISKHKQTESFQNFCNILAENALKLKINEKKLDDDEKAFIQIGDNLLYYALPLEKELEPFLEALSYLDQTSNQKINLSRYQINDLKTPGFLKLYIAGACPFCPLAVRQIVPLTFANKLINLKVIDGTLFPDMAESNDIKSAPTLLLDNNLRWTGSIPLKDIIDMISKQDPSKLSKDSLENMLKDGRASMLADLMINQQKIFSEFIKLLIDEKWHVRLGAMVAMEEIIENDKKLASKVIDPIWQNFENAGDSVKGDMLYILGNSGDAQIIPELNKILEGKYSEEVKEAAKEAIEEINEI